MRRAAAFAAALLAGAAAAQRPNILVVMADDWSYPHASAYGDPVVSTPAFDRIASEGVLFDRAFAPAPSCLAARAAAVTGHRVWRLQEAADLWGTLRTGYPTYPDLLQQAGYHVGSSGKGCQPCNVQVGGRTTDAAGPSFPSFQTFLRARPAGAPFCFWLGATEPHRPYVPGSGIAAGLDRSRVVVPPSLPDVVCVRDDLLDYYAEVQTFDAVLAAAVAELEALGELDDTIVVVTSDNGMPFPRAKANLYDTGTRVPLAVRWGRSVPPGRSVTDFVDLADLAPTLLAAAGLTAPASMNARSFLGVLLSGASGQVDPSRDHVILARERHTPAQLCQPWAYPMRAIRTGSFLYVENLEPSRMPAGVADAGAAYVGRSYSDVDDGPSKAFLIQGWSSPAIAPFAQLALGCRAAAELYDLRADPGQVRDLAGHPDYAGVQAQLAARLRADRVATADPRLQPGPSAFDAYPYYDPSIAAPTLTTDDDQLSIFGDVLTFSLDASRWQAGRAYLLLGSASGTAPGWVLPGATLPLVPDAYTALTAVQPNPLITGGLGVLDAAGRATASMTLPAGLLGPSALGAVVHHAFLVADPAGGFALASNPCALGFR